MDNVTVAFDLKARKAVPLFDYFRESAERYLEGASQAQPSANGGGRAAPMTSSRAGASDSRCSSPQRLATN